LIFGSPALTAIYHIVQENARKSAKLRCAELIGGCFMSLLQGDLADIGACHGGGFSSSCGARKDRTGCPGEIAERDGAK
jgi:hypothetical protein